MTPIKLTTFASPQPGHLDFANTVDELADMGRIHHCRVTNNDDLVPQMGFISFLWSMIPFVKLGFNEGFRHSGFHLNLFPYDRDPAFDEPTKSKTASGMSFISPLLKLKVLKNHSLEEYHD